VSNGGCAVFARFAALRARVELRCLAEAVRAVGDENL
jgi:hypothetical protein